MICKLAVLLLMFANPALAVEPEPTPGPQSITSGCEAKVAPQPRSEDDSIFAPFPNPNTALENDRLPDSNQPVTTGREGFLTNTVPFNVENVLIGYKHSIFPFIVDQRKMHWFTFPKRGILDFSEFKLKRSSRKFLKKTDYAATMNEDFAAVIEACADASKNVGVDRHRNNWIKPATIELYKKLHDRGYAHSVEVWSQGPSGRELVGGLYGVLVDGVFFGESTFTNKSEAGRFAVLKLVEFLASKGLTWIDLQMVTPMTQEMGGKEISRAAFIQRLRASQASPVHFAVEKLNLGTAADYFLKNE